KCVLHRLEDMRMTGKRNPYSSDYKIGLDENLNIIAYETIFFQNSGAAADLSPAVLDRTLFHTTNSYFIPNVTATGYSCRTNLPPNTAFRGFGGPQGMFVIEAAIHHAARELDVDASIIQQKNLLKKGDEFPYGQLAGGDEAWLCWQEAVERYDLESIREDIHRFNMEHEYVKKGLALMPICFGISFTNTSMNQARALVHVYSDGSVGVSTGAVEMGQGVNMKMLQVAAKTFGIPIEKVKLETTNTSRVANTSPSAASSTADLNGKALEDACLQILRRLETVAAGLVGSTPFTVSWGAPFTADGGVNAAPQNSLKAVLPGNGASIEIKDGRVFFGGSPTDLTWDELIKTAFLQRINLSAKGHYATPEIHFNRDINKGHPFAYHVFGTAIIIATIDCIRGTYKFDAVKVVHDFGASMNRQIDLGQAEGGIVQGIGWMTCEELI
ncbi:MAG: molybdopterin cofactor-binding domain-containing protein, partial [Bacteroidota bacterium]